MQEAPRLVTVSFVELIDVAVCSNEMRKMILEFDPVLAE